MADQPTSPRKAGKRAATKAATLYRAKATQTMLDKAETKATQAAQVRDEALTVAQQSGATYAEMGEATGLSTSRLTQILRRARQSV